MNFSLSKSQRQWLIAFLLVSLLLPIMLASILVGIGNISGCQMAVKTAQICVVGGINIGQTIKALVDWTWYMPALIGFQVPMLSLGLLVGVLVLIYKSFRGWPRVLIGFFSIWYLYFAPIIAGIGFVVYLAGQVQCSLNEGGVGSCYLFGLDMGSTFHTAATIPWLLFILLPMCVLTSIVYSVIALVNLKRES